MIRKIYLSARTRDSTEVREDQQMRIEEDIFADFFDKLKKDAKFPNEIVEKLRKFWEADETMSKEKILKALEIGGTKGTTNNQDN